jgi:hypothetical protein
VPESVRDVMTFHLASRVEEAINLALEPVATEVSAAA